MTNGKRNIGSERQVTNEGRGGMPGNMIRKALIVGFILFAIVCDTAVAIESMQFKSEAEKLIFIRDMLKKEKHLWLSEYSASHCKQIMEDFLAGKDFKAIEPDYRADSIDDPRLERWNRCRQIDYHDLDVDPHKFFGGLSLLGGPPYRFYRIELDGNKENGLEDMVYYQQPSDPNKYGNTGYTWVDLNNCECKDGFPVGSMTQFAKKADAVSLNTLVYYEGKLWAMDYVEGIHFSLQRWVDRTNMETCQWYCLDPEKIKIERTGNKKKY